MRMQSLRVFLFERYWQCMSGRLFRKKGYNNNYESQLTISVVFKSKLALGVWLVDRMLRAFNNIK